MLPEASMRPDRYRELKAIAHEGMRAFMRLGPALLEIRKHHGYRFDGYETYDQFLEAEFDLTRRHADRYILAWQVSDQLVSEGLPPPLNEAQARELAPLLPMPEKVADQTITVRPEVQSALVDVWREVSENGAVTASKVKLAVAAKRMELYPPPERPTPPPRQTEITEPICIHCPVHCPSN